MTKSLLALTGLGGAAAVGFFFKSRFFSRLLEKRTSDEVLFHGNTREKVIALTIDDGPHALLTADILDVLAAYAVPATFFIIGSQVPGNEALLERIVHEGHELGNHLMSDRRSIALGPEEFTRQLAETHALIAPFGPVRWFRPGSGWYNERMLAEIKPYGYRCVVGSLYPYDAQFQSVEFASSYILSNAQPGSIIILHDGKPERQATPDILQRIIPALHRRGYRFVTLTELAETAVS
ncbi:MAG: polysaccharide deacetylase family protein [Anaerolineales bacterium]|nr:polysaccharide deacetylase family protein [Anaerolineales bacterium]